MLMVMLCLLMEKHRISVEYLVQKKIIESKIKVSANYILVSNVEVGPYTEMPCVQKLADEIVNDFNVIYCDA